MSLLRNQTAREISETMTRIVRKWDNLSEKEKKSGLFIDPDKAIVVSAELTTIQDAKADVDGRIHLSVIGIGGGAASSRLSTAADSGLDFDAVQRGDAEMENKMNRLIRACIELGDKNPIRSIHDQGAGGNSNVLKEIAEPAGCKLDLRALLIGDPSLSQLEIWGSEYQENCALLLHGPRGGPSELLFQSIAERENCPFSVLGEVTDDGRVVIVDSKDGSTPVDLDLDKVLGKLPQKNIC